MQDAGVRATKDLSAADQQLNNSSPHPEQELMLWARICEKGSHLRVVFTLFFIEFALLLCCGILVLLVLGHEVIHVRLGLSKLHFIHSFSRVPMEERLAPEHGCEVLRNTLEHLLNGCRVARKGNRHLQALRWDIAYRGFDIVRDPLYEVRRILILNIKHLLIDFFCGHAATEQGCRSEVAAMARVGSAHHVLGVEHLLRKLLHGEGTILLRATRGEWREACHEEVQARERNKIHGDLP